MDRVQDGDSTAAPAPRHPVRAVGVAAAWALAATPALTGIQRCPSALFLHRPCPGCGMTRAVWRLVAGDVHGSLAMHPLAIPAVVATALVALAMVRVTFLHGTPATMASDRLSRVAVVAFAAVQCASVLVWIARLFGAFGGPVAV